MAAKYDCVSTLLVGQLMRGGRLVYLHVLCPPATRTGFEDDTSIILSCNTSVQPAASEVANQYSSRWSASISKSTSRRVLGAACELVKPVNS